MIKGEKMEKKPSKDRQEKQENLNKTLLENDEIHSMNINFFNLNKELLGEEFVEDIVSKNPYTDLEQVQGILSHLSYIDTMQNRKNIALGKVENKPLNFEIELNNKNNQQIIKYAFNNVNLGEGNFTKGIEHLLSIGMVKERSTFLKRLDKNLRIPNELQLDKLERLGHSTTKALKAIAQSEVLGEDLSVFMDNLLKNLFEKDSSQDNQNKQFAKEQQKMFAQVKEFASQKKTETKEYEISNHKSIGMAR